MSNQIQKLLKFNKDNLDVYQVLKSKSNASQYVCEAVRFFESYTQVNNIDNSKDNNINDSLKKIFMQLDKIETIITSTNIKSIQNKNLEYNTSVDDELRHLIISEED